MALISSRLPPMHDGDRIWFAMLDEGEPVDCYVESDVLERLSRSRSGSGSVAAQFEAYRPVFEIMLNDLFVRGERLVIAADGVTRWEL